MNCLGLLELSDPVPFDPVGPVTAVFYDDKNQQVFSVRSGGATGIVVKSPAKAQKTFVLEDKGPILSIKLSPDQKVLAIQRTKNSLDLYNVDNGGQIDTIEYTLTTKNKSCPILGFVWSSIDELVTISDVGLDIYNVVAARKLIKYVRGSSTSVSWYISCPVTNHLVTSPTLETTSLQVWSIRNSNIIKLPGIDFGSSSVKEKDVSLINIYRDCFVRVNLVEGGAVVGIRLYTVDSDQVTLSHHLSVNVQGSLGLQTLDNLILVHSLQDSSTQIFDIACTVPNQLDTTGPLEHQPILLKTSITGKGSCVPLSYSPTWVIVLPGILVDARHGHMYTLVLKLNRAESEDPVLLSRFHLHRTAGKPHLLGHLKQSLLQSTVPLRYFSLMFHDIVLAYHLHQNVGELPATHTVGYRSILGGSGVLGSVVLDQSEIYTAVLAHAEKEGVPLARVQGVLVELLLTLYSFKVPPRQFILELFINLAVQTHQYYQMHQFIQYGVISDSKHLACILLSLESVYPPASQIALDMMSRLGNAVEELIEICLAEGKVVEAINLARDSGLSDTVSARKYLEAAKHQDTLTFYNVFSFFEERNIRLKGTVRFSSDEQCEPFIQQFQDLFLKSDQT